MSMEEEDQEELQDQLAELLVVEDELTDWEVDFLKSLLEWDGDFTEKQGATLRKIYKRIYL